MQKIISLFERNYEGNRKVRPSVVEGAEWVIAGEGVATRKYDGTCCMIDEKGLFWKRYEVKEGKTAPEGFVPANDIDTKTGKQQGWVLVDDEDPQDQWHREALGNWIAENTGDIADPGTYELVGPKIQGNPENYPSHMLIKHDDAARYENFPRDFEGIKAALKDMGIEGIVWHHPDGRMVKIKRKDFDYAS